MDWSDEVRARLVREEERLRYKAANLQARGKTVMAAQELVVADDIRAALGEIEECHRIAGEAIGTDPSLRSSACVSALAVHCEWLRERAERAESAMDNLAGKLSKAEAEVERLRIAGQRCMEISTGLAAAEVVGHMDILNVMSAAMRGGGE